jgi:hypothetical protein
MAQYDSPDMPSRSITGAAETRQAAQRSLILGNLQFTGTVASSSRPARDKPEPGDRE